MAEFDSLTPETMVMIFKCLPSEDQFFSSHVCKLWQSLIAITGLDLKVCDEGTLVSIRLLRGTGVTKFIPGGVESDFIDMPQRFWPLVKNLSLNGCVTTADEEVFLIMQRCSRIESLDILDPSEKVYEFLPRIFTNNAATLTRLKYVDLWCGITDTDTDDIDDTDFDFEWIKNCLALRQLQLMVRSGRYKQIKLMPRGITDFYTSLVIPMDTVFWISDNLKALVSLGLGVNEVVVPAATDLDESEDKEDDDDEMDLDSDDLPPLNTFEIFLDMVDSLPKVQTILMYIHSKGLSNPKILEDQLETLEFVCDNSAGMECALSPFPDTLKPLFVETNNKIQYIFICLIDRTKFSGINID